uniref:Uncharacterized protein LOC113786358 n=1 Tax=Cicer arietinum TaxID=3827 RepID=A0A3Q7YAS3_CICAR|nr:uncharacterized protein LOC113786358 [Cicer arietinum]
MNNKQLVFTKKLKQTVGRLSYPFMSITSISKSINRTMLLKPQVAFRQLHVFRNRLIPLSSTLLQLFLRCVAVPSSEAIGDGEVEVGIKPSSLHKDCFFSVYL